MDERIGENMKLRENGEVESEKVSEKVREKVEKRKKVRVKYYSCIPYCTLIYYS